MQIFHICYDLIKRPALAPPCTSKWWYRFLGAIIRQPRLPLRLQLAKAWHRGSATFYQSSNIGLGTFNAGCTLLTDYTRLRTAPLLSVYPSVLSVPQQRHYLLVLSVQLASLVLG